MLVYHLNHQLPNNQSPFSSPEGSAVSGAATYRNNASTIDSTGEVFVLIVRSAADGRTRDHRGPRVAQIQK